MAHRKGPKPNNYGKPWIGAQIKRLKQMVKGNTPTPLIADALGRTEAAIRSKASEESISLKPVNKPPYTRRKRT